MIDIVKVIDILIEKLREKQSHYSGPLSSSDWVDILEEAKDEIKKQVIYEPIILPPKINHIRK